MLIANYSYINQICGHNHSGITNPFQWIRPHVMRGYFSYSNINPNAEQIKRDSFPTGTNPPYTLVMGDKGALLSSTNTTNGVGTLAGSMAMGKALAADLEGSSDMSGSLSLVVQMACDILGASTLSASISGTIQMAASMAGSGDISGSLKLLAGVVCAMSGSSSVSGNLRGTSSLSADLTPFTTLSPENLAASVWNSVAASFNVAGTMGEKMNDAGSASNPWTEIIESGYTAAEILRLLAAANLGKTSGQPDAPVFRDIADTKDRITATVDSSGNRTNIVLDES